MPFLHLQGNWAHCQLQRQIKIRHQFTAGYSWCVLSVCLSSGDKQSEGQTNTLTRYRCCFHARNQQNRLRDRGAKCQTAAKEQNCCCCCCWRSSCFCSSRLTNCNAAPRWPHRGTTDIPWCLLSYITEICFLLVQLTSYLDLILQLIFICCRAWSS